MVENVDLNRENGGKCGFEQGKMMESVDSTVKMMETVDLIIKNRGSSKSWNIMGISWGFIFFLETVRMLLFMGDMMMRPLWRLNGLLWKNGGFM